MRVEEFPQDGFIALANIAKHSPRHFMDEVVRILKKHLRDRERIVEIAA